MEDPPQQNHDAAVRDIPSSYPFLNDPQMSSTSTPSWSGPSGSSYFPPSNMIPPPTFRDQSNPTHCTLAHPSTYEQAQPLPHDPLPPHRIEYNLDKRAVPASSHSQPPASPEHYGHRLSSDLLESHNWSMASNLGSGRSVSQLEDTDDSEHAGGSSSGYAQPYRHYPAEHDVDDEGSDAMSDGIASDEGVYYSSGSDRDVFDDEDFDSFDSDEEYEYSDS